MKNAKMNYESLIGKKIYFGKYTWKIIDWNFYGCKLICDVFGGDQFFLHAWDRTSRLDIGEEVAWPRCELYDWLNDDFLRSSFSEEESACIINEASSIHNLDSEQSGVFLLERSELIKHTNIYIDNCWTLDADVWDYDEEAVTNEKYVQPVIWIDFALIDSLIPGWKELAINLAFSDNNDFGIPNPVQFYKKLTENYSLAIGEFLEMLESASECARKYYYEQIYEVLYDLARNDDSASIDKVFELCPDLDPEGYYSYDQLLPLGEAIENESYSAICALVNNGCDIDCATMAQHSTLTIASSEKMILFLIEKGASVQFSDIMDIWVWAGNPDLAKKVIKMTSPSNTQQYMEYAKSFYDDKSIYCYGALETEDSRKAFQEMVSFLEKTATK